MLRTVIVNQKFRLKILKNDHTRDFKNRLSPEILKKDHTRNFKKGSQLG